MTVAPLARTLHDLARTLHAVSAGPVAWAGPGGQAYYRLTGHAYPELEELSDGSGSDAEMLASALGWVYARRMEGLEGPLVVVVEDELGPGFAEALAAVSARQESVLVVLVDLGRRYLSAVRTGWGFLSRESSQASLQGFLESLGIQFLGSHDARKPERFEELLQEAMSQEQVRLLHLLGQPAELSVEEGPRSDQYHLSRPPDRPAWTTPVQNRRALPPDTLAQAVLARLASDLEQEPQAVVYWTVAEAPGPLAMLGQRCLRRSPGEVLAEARGAARGGLSPYLVLSARRLPEIFSQLLEGVDFPATLLVLDGGLQPMAPGLPPHPASLRDLAMLRMIPNVVLAAPADEEEARRILAGSRDYPGPVALRFTAAPAVGLGAPGAARPAPPGQGRQLRSGPSVALLGAGSTVFPCVLAAETLAAWGVQASVFDLRWLEPLDTALLEKALTCQKLVTVEEHLSKGGAGTAVLEAMQRLGRTVPSLALALADDAAELPAAGLESGGLSAEGIAVAVRKFLGMGEGI